MKQIVDVHYPDLKDELLRAAMKSPTAHREAETAKAHRG